MFNKSLKQILTSCNDATQPTFTDIYSNQLNKKPCPWKLGNKTVQYSSYSLNFKLKRTFWISTLANALSLGWNRFKMGTKLLQKTISSLSTVSVSVPFTKFLVTHYLYL